MSATTADIPSKYPASRTARIAFCGTKSLRSLPRKMPALASLGPPCRPEGGGKALPRRPSRPGRALRRAAGAALRPHRAGESPRPLGVRGWSHGGEGQKHTCSPERGRPGSARWASSGTPWRTPTSVRQSWPGASPTWRSGSRRSWLRRGGAAERLRRACWVRARGRGHGGLGPRLCCLVFEGAEERGRPCAGACAEGDGERTGAF